MNTPFVTSNFFALQAPIIFLRDYRVISKKVVHLLLIEGILSSLKGCGRMDSWNKISKIVLILPGKRRFETRIIAEVCVKLDMNI